ncbi:dienelactone hydrolase family protein [Streptacidiphilus jiangxiensis]|uniref:Carboxymethylenebutenolidase n=1 Tax=Streptacidiphilus jiangxiensis TaxID=235985 RepID=A0A1H7W319_STRJI|nr:dienelactone hydrolase family protein [Streptacidiphilus jiangxiensis]SEM15397.1 carboxymethylenebutenolidase [Streptacidiphilus jiangxiensis]
MTSEDTTAVTAITTDRIEMPVPGGSPMGGYLARPTGPGEHPGVIVAMELFGVDAHVRGICDDLARRGFTALAPDFYHRVQPGADLPHDASGRTRGFELLPQLTRTDVLADVSAALAALDARGVRLAGMLGLSAGGHLTYLAATALDIPNAVVCYGGWLTGNPDLQVTGPEPTLSFTPRISGRLLYLVGADDHVIGPEEQREIAAALEAAGPRHAFVAYPGAGHSFLRDESPAAADAHERIEAWLRGK